MLGSAHGGKPFEILSLRRFAYTMARNVVVILLMAGAALSLSGGVAWCPRRLPDLSMPRSSVQKHVLRANMDFSGCMTCPPCIAENCANDAILVHLATWGTSSNIHRPVLCEWTVDVLGGGFDRAMLSNSSNN